MQLQKASRKKASIKMGLQGPSGSGKTYYSLFPTLANSSSHILRKDQQEQIAVGVSLLL